ncbi:MAG: substrate-binding domain-containing protein [Planctomycetes bacterium]|nr:substrate-binding domain-containing protein [Planctomycetota bacterium]
MRKMFFLSLLAAIVLTVQAWSGEKKNYLIGMTTMCEASFFDAVEEGVLSVLRPGDRLVYVEGQLDANFQQGIIEDFIAQGVDIVLYNPSDSAASLPSLKMMKEAGVPIINFDSKAADLSYCETYCATDNYQAGVVAAEYLMKEHPEGGKVGVIEYVAVESASQRSQGFVDAILASGKWNMVARLDGGNTTDGALPVAEDIITANPDLTAFFCANDEMGLGAYSAVKAAGMKTHIYSVNGGPESKKTMKQDGVNGIWRATSAQAPIVMGKTSMNLAYDVLDGKEIKDEYLLVPFIISPYNIDEYGNADWQ